MKKVLKKIMSPAVNLKKKVGNTLIAKYVGSFVRHLVTGIGFFLAGHGYISPEEAESLNQILYGAAMILFGQVWSWQEKKD